MSAIPRPAGKAKLEHKDSGSQRTEEKSEQETVSARDRENLERLSDLEAQIQDRTNDDQMDQAVSLARQALELAEKVEDTHPDELALAANNLAVLLQMQGEYGEARPLFERALAITEKCRGQWSLFTATYLSRLSSVLRAQGDFARAEQLLQRSLNICEGADPSGIRTVEALRQLADLFDQAGKSTAALSLYERALLIVQKDPKLYADVSAELQCDLAAAYQNSGQLEKAAATLEAAMGRAGTLTPTDQAALMTNLGMLRFSQERFMEAKQLYSAAARFYEEKDSQSMLLPDLLNSLAYIEVKLNNPQDANRYFLRAASIVDLQVQKLLPNLPLAGQRAFLENKVMPEVSLLLDHCQGPQLASAYDIVYRWKGLLLQSIRKESILSGLSSDPVLARKVQRLRLLRSAVAASYVQSMSCDLKVWLKEHRELTEEKERLEEEISRCRNSLPSPDELAQVTLSEFCTRLGGQSAFVDIYQYFYTGKDHESGLRYMAVVSARGKASEVVDLGSQEDIDKTVQNWHRQASIGALADSTWAELVDEVWIPVQRALPIGTKTVWICPDGSLHKVPWHLLACAKERTDRRQILIADSAREILGLQSRSSLQAKHSLLLAGGVDYNAEPENSRSTVKSVLEMPFLPGSLKEVQELHKLALSQKMQVTELVGDEPTKEAVVAALPKADFVHLATHGLFLNAALVDKTIRSQDEPVRAIKVHTRLAVDLERSPLVQSALALVGANRFEESKGDYAGLLTAEELIGIDLSRCEHVTLSACETGLGTGVRMQGVLGLRSAILGAGARSVLLSLWTVPDEATKVLMEKFYANLWVKQLPKAEALRLAQESVRDTPYDKFKEPKNWAGWILIGK